MPGDIVEFYGLVGSPALGETARDVAKDLPIRFLHGVAATWAAISGHAAWMEAHGLTEGHPVFPLMARLEGELRGCRREVYQYMARPGVAGDHDEPTGALPLCDDARQPTYARNRLR